MINLMLSWFSFIIFIILFQELNQLQYILYSSFMFYFIYLYNLIYLVQISSKTVFLIISIPTIIFYYILFVYNDFLSLTPMKYEIVISLSLFHFFILVFIISKQNPKHLILVTKRC
jgi:hypothetical protein